MPNFVTANKQEQLAGRLMVKPLYNYQLRLFRSLSRFRYIVKARQIGVSTLFQVESLISCLTEKNYKVLVVSENEDKAAKFIREAKDKLKNYPGWKDFIVVDNTTELRFYNGSSMTALPCRNTEACRSYTASHLILDEFGAMSSVIDTNALWAAALPTLTRGGKLSVIGTPNGKSNKFYELYIDEDSEFEKFEIGQEECPDPEFRASIPILKKELQKIPGLYEQEYELSWEGISQGATWSWAELEEITKDTYVGKGFRVAGFDPAKKSHNSAFLILDILNGAKRIIYTDNFAGLPHPEQAKRVKEKIDLYQVDRLAIDAWGIGEAVLDNLKGIGCKVVQARLKKSDRQSLFIKMKSDSEKNKFFIIKSKYSNNLKSDLSTFDVGSGEFTVTKDGHMDYLSALMQAYSTLTQKTTTIGNIYLDLRGYKLRN